VTQPYLDTMETGATKASTAPTADTPFVLVGSCDHRIWGRRVDDTLAKQLEKSGLANQVNINTEASGSAAPNEEDRLAAHDEVVLARADTYLDRCAISLLRSVCPSVFLAQNAIGQSRALAVYCKGKDAKQWRAQLDRDGFDNQKLLAGTHVIAAESPPLVYDYELRKQSLPLIRSVTPDVCLEIERTTFGLAYKGVTDIVTKYVYPWPAFHATRLAANLGLTPNSITFVSVVLVFVVMALFAQGQFAAGVAVGFLMSFLDTLDGKLARVTQQTSKFGKHFDHITDLVHPPFWWLAYWWGAGGAQPPAYWNEAAIVTALGYVAIRVQEWRFKRRLGVRIHVWQPFDSQFRLITTRRNTNLLLLAGAVGVGEPTAGLFAVAAWTVASLAIHGVRWAQAEVELRRSGKLTSWLERL
jgi:phosphatidylglycerophosphate synthase